MTTPAERQKAYRDRKRGGPPPELQQCGTRAAAERHRRAHEPLCDDCAAAEREYHNKLPEGDLHDLSEDQT